MHRCSFDWKQISLVCFCVSANLYYCFTTSYQRVPWTIWQLYYWNIVCKHSCSIEMFWHLVNWLILVLRVGPGESGPKGQIPFQEFKPPCFDMSSLPLDKFLVGSVSCSCCFCWHTLCHCCCPTEFIWAYFVAKWVSVNLLVRIL